VVHGGRDGLGTVSDITIDGCRLGDRPAMNPDETKVHERDTSYTLAEWRNVYAVVWRAQPDARRAQRMGEHFRRVVRAHPEGVMVVVIVPTSVPPPDDAARDRINEAMRAAPSVTRAIAYVLVGTGFGAATMRGAVTDTLLAAKPPYPVRVFATIAEAASWIVERAGPDSGLTTSSVSTALGAVAA
jgi:hypothetical protein